jgi:porin
MRRGSPILPIRWIKIVIYTAIFLGAAGAAGADSDPSANANPPNDPASAPTGTEWQANYGSGGNRPGSFSSLREGPTGGIWQRSQLLGDPLGLRSYLGRYGVTLNIQETSEYGGNTSGGSRQGFEYDGLTTIDLQLNTLRAFHLRDGLFNVSALDIHGHNLSADNLKTLQTASGIEADNAFRLWELWYQQGFFYRQFDVKVGVQSLDQEFIYSQYAGLFVNTMFGWPMLTSADMLGGGPAYPLASLGARFRVQPVGTPWSFLAGIFDDNPSGITSGSTSDPQELDAHGTNFRLRDKALVIAEIQYSRPAVGEMEYPEDKGGIYPGTYKLGFWYDAGQFADQRYDTNGLSLANPASNHNPQMHNGNYSFYAVVDQLVWRKDSESPNGIGVFARAMGAPGNQNEINFSMNAGATWRALFKHREYDVLGVGMGYARVSDRAVSFDQDTVNYSNVLAPTRSGETFVELTYQYQLVPWWQLQPDFQYVINPGAGIANPTDPTGTQKIANEFVMILRTNINF